ncbi:MAG: DUF1365 family protein [Proteobacteria bacterium]|nr:DUF1365 family protein [Pseudomonadota bacterium]
MTSALYAGVVVHQRFRPTRHRLRYSMDWMLLDLDEVPTARLFSRNRFNLVSFHDRDHLGRGAAPAAPLRVQVEAAMTGAGLVPDGGPIRVLCMPRVLGHVFNPLSVFFCHRRDGSVAALLYEVNNTFGQRHSYLIPVEAIGQRVIRQHCAKAFYVSPFLQMDIIYNFRVLPPGETTAVVINGDDAEGRIIAASFAGRRQPLTDRALLGLVARHGLLSLKVLAAIHWEALKLWLKGVRMQPRPEPPAQAVTIIPTPQG